MIFFKRKFKERGAALVESSLALGLLLILMLGAIDLSRAIYESLSIQFSLSRTARWAALGEVLTNPGPPPVVLSREQSIASKVTTMARSFGVDLSSATINICPASDQNCTINNAGGPNGYAVVRARKPFRLSILRTTINLSGSAVFKNEPYA